MMMDIKSEAIHRLQRQRTALDALSADRTSGSDAFARWQRATRVAIENTFGAESKHVKEFGAIYFHAPIVTQDTTENDKQQWYERGLQSAKRLLDGFIEEVSEYWKDTESQEANVEGNVRLFVSHRSSDRELAKAISDLACKALGLTAREVRCTSVDGYRLPGGADTARQLRVELLAAEALVGLITPAAMNSAYVLFELGARWGADKYLCPVLARGADVNMLGGPLGGKNALRLDSRAEAMQLIEDLASTLRATLQPWSLLEADLNEVVRLAKEPDGAVTHSSIQRGSIQRLATDDLTIRILNVIASDSEFKPTAEDIARILHLHVEKARYCMQRLENENMVTYVENFGTRERYYSLAQGGREVLIDANLL